MIDVGFTPQRVLLGQLGAFGDVLYATAVARQIKHDHPNAHLTWAIGSPAAPLLKGNPDVDSVWEWPMNGHQDMARAWIDFERAAKISEARGEFDAIYLTQIYPNNYRRFDGTVRQSIFRGYPGPITVPVEPRIELTDEECANVDAFVKRAALAPDDLVVLFEFGSKSGQSFVTPAFAEEFAHLFLRSFPDAKLILTSSTSLEVDSDRIINASELTFRENAELTHHASLLVGVSSGISWLSTSTWAKKLPTIQLLEAKTSVFASMVHDFEYRGEDASHILEMTNCSPTRLLHCIQEILSEGFPVARSAFHQHLRQDFGFWLAQMHDMLLRGEFNEVAEASAHTMRRYGVQPDVAAVLAELFKQSFLHRLVS